MEIGVEISLYPLEANFAMRIKAFLDRLRAAGRFKIVTTSLSTQVIGEYDEVVGALTREMRTVFSAGAGASGAGANAAGSDAAGASGAGSGKAVFLLKLFGPLSPPSS